MADEKYYTIPLTKREAAIIKLIRDEHTFGQITIVKANGEIARVHTEQTLTMDDIFRKFGLVDEHTNGHGLANGHAISNTVE